MPRDPEQRNVRVYTVACESRYVLVRNVPALGVLDELLQRLGAYGDICEHRVLDHDDALRAPTNYDDVDVNAGDEDAARARALDERFTEVVWVQFATVDSARHAKARAVQKPFFGSVLQIAYAPQCETRTDVLLKLTQRRELLQRRARGGRSGGDRTLAQPRHPPAVQTTQQRAEETGVDFIGPQLPPRDWRSAPPVPPPPPPPPLLPIKQSQPLDTKPKRRRI